MFTLSIEAQLDILSNSSFISLYFFSSIRYLRTISILLLLLVLASSILLLCFSIMLFIEIIFLGISLTIFSYKGNVIIFVGLFCFSSIFALISVI